MASSPSHSLTASERHADPDVTRPTLHAVAADEVPVRTFTVDLHVLAQLAGHARRGTIGVTYTARAEAFGDSPVGIGHIGTRIAVAGVDQVEPG